MKEFFCCLQKTTYLEAETEDKAREKFIEILEDVQGEITIEKEGD